MKKLSLLFAVLMLAGTQSVFADDDAGNNACPVGLVPAANGQTLDQEFGPGTAAITRCIKKRHRVKVVIQINNYCQTMVGTACVRAYALENISNMLDDYQYTDGMVPGRDFEIVAVAHGPGGRLMLKNNPALNPFQAQVEGLIQRGVKFYFCQNTVRAFVQNGSLPAGNVTANIIDGVQYATAGLTAIADFESLGYTYVQP